MARKKHKHKKIKIDYVSISNIAVSKENPQEMDDTTFDQLVEGIETEGFDEPVQVMPKFDENGEKIKGQYIMLSGHHRMKAAKVVGMTSIPCVIKHDMDDTGRQIALVRRNQLRGSMNPEKFTKLYNSLIKKGIDREVLKMQMGFTKKDAFEKVYKSVESSLPKKQRKKLAEAKEDIKSVDDMSSVLNRIFQESGSELDMGYMVFSFGGKKHHYFKVDKQVHDFLTKFEANCEKQGVDALTMWKITFGLDKLQPVKKTAIKKKRKKVSLKARKSKP